MRNVIYDGVCLFFQLKKYNRINSERNMTRMCLRQYNSSRRRRIMSRATRLERKVSENSILSVASVRCCSRRCTQHFPREAVEALRTEMWSADHALRKHMKLQVHRNAYVVERRRVVSLESFEVCLNAWYIIHSVSKADFYRFKRNSAQGMRASHHGNRGTKKRRTATQQAFASLSAMIECSADLMPHKFRTLPTGERVVECVLPAGTKWKDLQHRVNEVMSCLISITVVLTL